MGMLIDRIDHCRRTGPPGDVMIRSICRISPEAESHEPIRKGMALRGTIPDVCHFWMIVTSTSA